MQIRRLLHIPKLHIPKRPWYAVGAVAVLYTVVCGFLAYREPLWRDEIQTLRTTQHGVLYAAKRAVSFELQPPFYFAVQACWRRLFSAPHAARLLSALFGAATIVVGAKLSVRLLPRVCPIWVAVLIASSPHVVWAGTEARVYALTMLLGAALVLLFVRVHVDGWKGGRPWFVALGIVSLYTHYYLSFVLAAGGILLVLMRRWREVLAYGVEMVAVLAAFVPLARAVREQAQVMAIVPTWNPRLLPWEMETTTTHQFVGTWSIRETGGLVRIARWLVRILAIAAVAKLLQSARHSVRIPMAPAILATFSMLSFFIGRTIAGVVAAPFQFRYQMGHTIAALLLPIALAQPLGTLPTYGLLALLVGVNGWTTLAEHRTLGRVGNSEAAARTLERQEQPNEPILTTPADAVLELGFYYRGKNRLVPVPKQASDEAYVESELRVQSAEDLAGVLRQAGSPSAFWLYSVESEMDAQLDAWLEAEWDKTESKAFEGGRFGSGRPGIVHLLRFAHKTVRPADREGPAPLVVE